MRQLITNVIQRTHFYEELGCIFDKFINTNTKIALGDSNAKVGREDIFIPIIGNESLH
jgi:hypothetical protein